MARPSDRSGGATRNYSGFVLGNPSTRSPGFHFPRRFNNSIRSKRFKTLRFAAILLLDLRLECCDMISPERFPSPLDRPFPYHNGTFGEKKFLCNLFPRGRVTRAPTT
jgi:hypothetical protein